MPETTFALNLDANGRLSNLLDDVFQSIRVILLTRKGEKIHDPEFGCGAWDEVDRPHTRAPFIVKEVIKALRKYEPRVEVAKVTPSIPGDASGRMTVTIEFKLLLDGNTYTTTV